MTLAIVQTKVSGGLLTSCWVGKKIPKGLQAASNPRTIFSRAQHASLILACLFQPPGYLALPQDLSLSCPYLFFWAYVSA